MAANSSQATHELSHVTLPVFAATHNECGLVGQCLEAANHNSSLPSVLGVVVVFGIRGAFTILECDWMRFEASSNIFFRIMKGTDMISLFSGVIERFARWGKEDSFTLQAFSSLPVFPLSDSEQ